MSRRSDFDSAYQALCRPAVTADALSRRRFLQAAAATAGAMAVPPMLGDLAQAGAFGANDRILVLIMMGGGNDTLNTVVPTNKPAYHDLRGSLAIPGNQTLPIGGGFGLHPSLSYLKQRWNQGDVAIVHGVGNLADDHSHFSSLAQWMTGSSQPGTLSGWAGRYLDGVPGALSGISVGDQGVPLHLIGDNSMAVGLPRRGDLFGADQTNLYETLVFDAIQDYAVGGSGNGALGDLIADVFAESIDTAQVVEPIYTPTIQQDGLVADLKLAARLINLNLGARVVNVGYSGFDTHDDQAGDHADRLAELDLGLQTFFNDLSPAQRSRTTVMTFSEFGRRAEANDSNGTDHGSAGSLFFIGGEVSGGFFGEHPSLTNLTERGDLATSVDFRSVYATVLEQWLQADSNQILGGNYETLDIFGPRGSGGVQIDPGTHEQQVVWQNGQWVVVSSSSVEPDAVTSLPPDPGAPPRLGSETPPRRPLDAPITAPTATSELDAYRKGLISSDSRLRRPDGAGRDQLRRLLRPRQPA
ncbi:MAG: DUF1501 domain-containing protein [Acidimicrobiales bacterium]